MLTAFGTLSAKNISNDDVLVCDKPEGGGGYRKIK